MAAKKRPAKVARTAAAPRYKLVQGLSKTSYESKVSFLIPNDISAKVVSALRSSKTELFQWQENDGTLEADLVNTIPTALADVVDLREVDDNVLKDSTEEEIIRLLKTGKVSKEFETQYLLVSVRSHKRLYDGHETSAVELSKPEHMALYDRLVAFVDLDLEYYFEEGREIFDIRLLTKAEFMGQGGWTKHDGADDSEAVDKLVAKFLQETNRYFGDSAPSCLDPEVHHKLSYLF